MTSEEMRRNYEDAMAGREYRKTDKEFNLRTIFDTVSSEDDRPEGTNRVTFSRTFASLVITEIAERRKQQDSCASEIDRLSAELAVAHANEDALMRRVTRHLNTEEELRRELREQDSTILNRETEIAKLQRERATNDPGGPTGYIWREDDRTATGNADTRKEALLGPLGSQGPSWRQHAEGMEVVHRDDLKRAEAAEARAEELDRLWGNAIQENVAFKKELDAAWAERNDAIALMTAAQEEMEDSLRVEKKEPWAQHAACLAVSLEDAQQELRSATMRSEELNSMLREEQMNVGVVREERDAARKENKDLRVERDVIWERLSLANDALQAVRDGHGVAMDSLHRCKAELERTKEENRLLYEKCSMLDEDFRSERKTTDALRKELAESAERQTIAEAMAATLRDHLRTHAGLAGLP